MNPPPSQSSTALDRTTARWFSEEVEPHESRLRAWLTGRFPQLRDVDDIVQDAYLRLFRARRTRTIRSVPAFLFTAARNAALDIFRRQGSCASISQREENGMGILDESPDAAESATISQEMEILAEAVRLLPDRCRHVFTLRKIYGLSQREVAEHLGISEHTVEVQMGKGTKRCAKYLKARGITR